MRVAILEDHLGIIDGYRYRLQDVADLEIVGVAMTGEALTPLLEAHPVDILILDVEVPTSETNPNPYPILHLVPTLLQQYPSLSILVITMHLSAALVKAVMDAGASGYLLKDDVASMRQLAAVLRSVASDGVHFSQQAYHHLVTRVPAEGEQLTPRQNEVLALCAAYPDATTAEVARTLGLARSTVRNLLSQSYLRLRVNSRAAAVARAWQLGLIAPPRRSPPSLPLPPAPPA